MEDIHVHLFPNIYWFVKLIFYFLYRGSDLRSNNIQNYECKSLLDFSYIWHPS